MKKIFLIVLFAFLPFTLNAESNLDKILSSGVLKVGTTGDWDPMTMKDPATNKYKGYVNIITFVFISRWIPNREGVKIACGPCF